MANEATTKKKKTFKVHDIIECRSITNGKYFLVGKKSDITYKWAGFDSIEGVEYQDLLYAVNSKHSSVFSPRFIILDEDFLAQNPKVQAVYDSMYTTEDLESIIDLPIGTMKKAISELPDGAIEGLKGLISTKINDGTLDSVKKIKILDEIFDTNLLYMLASE